MSTGPTAQPRCNERWGGRPRYAAMSLAADLLDILVCPVTRTPLRLDGDELVSDAAGLAFPIRRGTPVLIVGEARRLATREPLDADPTQ